MIILTFLLSLLLGGRYVWYKISEYDEVDKIAYCSEGSKSTLENQLFSSCSAFADDNCKNYYSCGYFLSKYSSYFGENCESIVIDRDAYVPIHILNVCHYKEKVRVEKTF
jgi:hypothetical protein